MCPHNCPGPSTCSEPSGPLSPMSADDINAPWITSVGVTPGAASTFPARVIAPSPMFDRIRFAPIRAPPE